jgi:serine/threonine protein phosphatase 1
MSQTIYAVGDIHGQLGMLDHALELIERDGGADARTVFLGDYIDRGAQSRQVIETLIQGQQAGRDWVTLLGNHDRMFSMFLEDYPRHDARLLIGFHWLHEKIGGLATLDSYGVHVGDGARLYNVHAEAKQAIPEAHITFLQSLKYSHQEDGYLFVHAGIRPGVDFDAQDPSDLIWIRDEFLDDPRPYPWVVVHGHSPAQQIEYRGNRINVDTGAAYGRPLSTIVIEGAKVWHLTDQGRVPVRPE